MIHLVNFFNRLKIRSKLMALLLPVVSIPMILLGTLLIRTSQQAVKESILRDYQKIARQVAGKIDLLVEAPQEILKSAAHLFAVQRESVLLVRGNTWDQQTTLVELRLADPAFERIAVVDLKGQELACSDLEMALQSWQGQSPFEDALRSGSVESVLHFDDERTPLMTMAIPLKNRARVAGFLVARLTLRGMWRLLERIRVGRTGTIFVVAHDSQPVMHPDKKVIMAPEALEVSPFVEDVLAGRAGSLERHDQYGRPWLSAYAPIRGLGWGVVINQPAEEAFAGMQAMATHSRLIILLSVVVAVLLGLVLAQSLAAPVRQLTERARRIAAGDLSTTIQIQRGDELGELARSFNEMTRAVKKGRDELEARVAERTRQLQEALGELQTIYQKKSEFLSQVAHEVRQSITNMKGSAETIRRIHERGRVDEFQEQIRQRLVSIVEDGDRLNLLLQDLLDLARLEAGSVAFQFEPTDLPALVKPLVVAMCEREAKQLDLRLEAAASLQPVQADPEYLRRSLENLLENAVKYTPAGGQVRVTLEPEEGGIRVGVSDTGVGIPARDLPHIFEPFYRVRRTSIKAKGTGLGLSFVRDIVRAHGGEVQVESQPARGSVFWFVLPYSSVSLAQPAQMTFEQGTEI